MSTKTVWPERERGTGQNGMVYVRERPDSLRASVVRGFGFGIGFFLSGTMVVGGVAVIVGQLAHLLTISLPTP